MHAGPQKSHPWFMGFVDSECGVHNWWNLACFSIHWWVEGLYRTFQDCHERHNGPNSAIAAPRGTCNYCLPVVWADSADFFTAYVCFPNLVWLQNHLEGSLVAYFGCEWVRSCDTQWNGQLPTAAAQRAQTTPLDCEEAMGCVRSLWVLTITQHLHGDFLVKEKGLMRRGMGLHEAVWI